MKTNIIFDIPNEIVSGLVKRQLIRNGGVIQEASSKQVVMWLRESSLQPLVPAETAASFPSTVSSSLNMVSSVASILNLGATIAFGMASLKKLKRIDTKLDNVQHTMESLEGKIDIIGGKVEEIEKKIGNLHWIVEFGFAYVLSSLEEMKAYQEIDIAGKLNSAASLAWSSQFLEPGSNQRMYRIEQALAQASEATSKVLLHLDNEMSKALDSVSSIRKGSDSIRLESSVIDALRRFRQASLALYLLSSVNAEAGDLESSAQKLTTETIKLEQNLQKLGKIYLEKDNYKVYLKLLSPELVQVMPIRRLDMWLKRFNPETGNIYDIIEILRKHSAQFYKNTDVDVDTMSIFSDLLDGSFEDLDRLKGYAIEYKYASEHNLDICQYRKALEISDVNDKSKITFLSITPEEEDTNT